MSKIPDPNFKLMLGNIDLTGLAQQQGFKLCTNYEKHTAVIQIPESTDLVFEFTTDQDQIGRVTCHLSCELLIMNLAKVGDEFGHFELPYLEWPQDFMKSDDS